ncbi:hypothetical protein GEMRC1_009302 [Eukaryota sp. GEM-RC1]
MQKLRKPSNHSHPKTATKKSSSKSAYTVTDPSVIAYSSASDFCNYKNTLCQTSTESFFTDVPKISTFPLIDDNFKNLALEFYTEFSSELSFELPFELQRLHNPNLASACFDLDMNTKICVSEKADSIDDVMIPIGLDLAVSPCNVVPSEYQSPIIFDCPDDDGCDGGELDDDVFLNAEPDVLDLDRTLNNLTLDDDSVDQEFALKLEQLVISQFGNPKEKTTSKTVKGKTETTKKTKKSFEFSDDFDFNPRDIWGARYGKKTKPKPRKSKSRAQQALEKIKDSKKVNPPVPSDELFYSTNQPIQNDQFDDDDVDDIDPFFDDVEQGPDFDLAVRNATPMTKRTTSSKFVRIADIKDNISNYLNSSDSEHSFKNVFNNTSSNVQASPHLNFVTLLHLCNEQGFNLTSVSNYSDLLIKRSL